MEIKTKYNIGDKVWIMHNNQIYHTAVEEIKTHSQFGYYSFDEPSTYTKTEYRLNGVFDKWFDENEGVIFDSEEVLIKHLSDKIQKYSSSLENHIEYKRLSSKHLGGSGPGLADQQLGV
jgi:hypothetical protein